MKARGFLQAAGVALYCATVGFLMYTVNTNHLLPKDPTYFGPVSFLLLFSTSALICALLVFYKPYMLFFSKRKKEAMELVVYTTGWLFVFFVLFFSLAVFLR